jgi:hypothetical protein
MHIMQGQWGVGGAGEEEERGKGVFYTYFYNHARRPRLKNLLYIGVSRSSRYFKALPDPGGGFTSEAAARRFQK